ncbi:branched-chain amino acid ABC transporter permease [Micromonospora halophytica]|uniref:branched-chain amino acid ABC transporter permease n=1 Tax=Micromonospora halophytica TaxID=47864 RepID=UPI001B8D9442|nr:branched-chain amino acid ABC transporter permease [Micromonospora halophytica]
MTVAALIVVVASPDAYLQASISRMAPFTVLAVSVAVVTGHAGLPTLGQVAPYAVGAYTTARLALAGITAAPVHLAAGALAGAVVAGVLGAALVRYRGTVFLMLSLAVAELSATSAAGWQAVTGGTDGLAGIPAPSLAPVTPALVDDRAVLLYAATVTTATTVAAILLLHGPRRLLLLGARGNEDRARASGHPVNRYLWLVHTGAGAVAGIGGALLIHTHRWITPADVGFTTAAIVLLAVVIGGATSLPGAVAGAVAVLTVRDVVALSAPGHAPLLLGVLFVAAVYVLPGGLAALPARIRHLPRPRWLTRAPDGSSVAEPVARSMS